MAYLGSITARAQRDLAVLYEEINAEHSDTALRWYVGLREAILTLEHHPNRSPIVPEDRRLRHLLYGAKPRVYRVIYRVHESRRRVEVIHIRPQRPGARPG